MQFGIKLPSLMKGNVIKSISGIPYTNADISTISILYSGEDRSNVDIELISKKALPK